VYAVPKAATKALESAVRLANICAIYVESSSGEKKEKKDGYIYSARDLYCSIIYIKETPEYNIHIVIKILVGELFVMVGMRTENPSIP